MFLHNVMLTNCQERLCMTGLVMCVTFSMFTSAVAVSMFTSAESTFAIRLTIRQMLNDPVGTQTPHEGVNATNPRS